MTEYAVVRGGEDAAVEGDVARRDQLGLADARLERRAGGGDAGLFRQGRPQRREPTGRRLDDQAELDQVEGMRQPLADRIQPAQYVGIQEMPVAARANPRAAARPYLDQPLARQGLDRFAQQVAANPQLRGQLALDRQGGAWR